jgi:hypothetical protein
LAVVKAKRRTTMSTKCSTNQESAVVYGSDTDDGLIFIKKETAIIYADLWKAYREELTFGEFRKRFPDSFKLFIDSLCPYLDIENEKLSSLDIRSDGYFSDLFDTLFDAAFSDEDMAEIFFDANLDSKDAAREYYEHELSIHERLPLEDEIFGSRSLLDFHFLIDLTGNPGSMRWIPIEILHTFGEIQDSLFDGPISILHSESEEKIVSIFSDYGYTCIRDDKLVNRACGY